MKINSWSDLIKPLLVSSGNKKARLAGLVESHLEEVAGNVSADSKLLLVRLFRYCGTHTLPACCDLSCGLYVDYLGQTTCDVVCVT